MNAIADLVQGVVDDPKFVFRQLYCHARASSALCSLPPLRVTVEIRRLHSRPFRRRIEPNTDNVRVEPIQEEDTEYRFCDD